MGKMSIAAILWMVLFVWIVEGADFPIGKYGAKPNSDITQAMQTAFKEACASPTPSKVVVPRGTYSLKAIKLEGPCKSKVEFVIDGTINAATEGTKEPAWISICTLDGFAMSGSGVLDGQGTKGWGKCKEGTYCGQLPMNVGFYFIKHGLVSGITVKDSKQFQVNVLGCEDFTFHKFKIVAPAESPNTDGIHIGRSKLIKIIECDIRTGDDCVSLGDANTDILVEKTTCGPGHGFSVGSLGKYDNEGPVIGFTVKNCTLNGCENGVRIKTWPDGKPGKVQKMRFEDIIVNNVGKAIILDQVYCPHAACNAKIPSKVTIDDVVFKNIKGTATLPGVVKIQCSPAHPCGGVELNNIDIKYTGPGSGGVCECANVKPKIVGKVFPPACTHPVSTLN